ncbi:LacI family DNA-binding transcriptional regulator [Loigolactobacillus binensis]|uniref:LacI family DNA-binding transcriptional regulator n=1 Tax=Loigolactobacillus binensis TaxID=2559922 RepID=A0ABW3EEK8_9LACO|nr:LacI family DNA-binding transcriptional regulator [Loigolactobacillus binensis]
MATIRDVARISGYSISTVSRTINQSGYVSKTAQLQINRVIHQLDYVPNAIARDLSTGKTHKIGAILPHIRDPYFSKILNGIMDAAFANNYSVILLPSEYDEAQEMHYLEQLKRKEYDGLIVTSHGIPLERLEKYNQYGPIVCCEDTGAKQLNAVFSDRESAYTTAFNWLKQKQIKRIAFLFSRRAGVSATSSITLKTFAQVYGDLPPDNLVITGVSTPAEGYFAAKTLNKQATDLQYIFGNGDDIISGVRQYYVDHQLPLPGLIGQGHQISGVAIGIPTIDPHFYTIGGQALQLVLEPTDGVRKIKVHSDFIINNKIDLTPNTFIK